MKTPKPDQAKLYVADRDRALRLLATCLRSMNDSEKQRLSSLLMENLKFISESQPSAETGLAIITAVGAAVVGELNANHQALKRKAGSN